MKKFLLSRILLAGALLLLGYSAVRAEKAHLLITTKSGIEASFYIADSPEITYQDNLLVIKAGNDELSTDAMDVVSFEFIAGDTSGVDQVSIEGSMLSGLPSGTPVEVYTFDGQHVASFKVDDSKSISIDLGNLTSGFYILRTPSASFKIKKQ